MLAVRKTKFNAFINEQEQEQVILKPVRFSILSEAKK